MRLCLISSLRKNRRELKFEHIKLRYFLRFFQEMWYTSNISRCKQETSKYIDTLFFCPTLNKIRKYIHPWCQMWFMRPTTFWETVKNWCSRIFVHLLLSFCSRIVLSSISFRSAVFIQFLVCMYVRMLQNITWVFMNQL